MTGSADQDVAACAACGTRFPAIGARFCPVCGSALSLTQTPMPNQPPPGVAAPPWAASVPAASGRPNRMPLIAGAGVVAVVAVVLGGAMVLGALGGPKPSPAPSVVALATAVASPTRASTPMPTATPTANPTPTPTAPPTPAPTPTPTATPAPSLVLADLLRPVIPSAIWDTCKLESGAGSLLGYASCSYPGVASVLYLRYDSAEELKAAYQDDVQRAKAIPATNAATCANANVDGTWTSGTGNDVPDQSLLCYQATGTGGELLTWIEQADPTTKVLFQAVASGDKRAELLAWWKDNDTVVRP